MTPTHDAITWATASLAALGLPLSAPFDLVKARAWSTVWQATTDRGAVFLKAAGPGFECEARLLPVLAEVDGRIVPRILAVDGERGWLLLASAGRCLREIIMADRAQGLALLAETLSRYARLQVQLAGRASVAVHAVDASLDHLAAHVADLLNDTTLLTSGGATAHETQVTFRNAVDHCQTLAAELAAHGMPTTIDHGDLHANNIAVAQDPHARIIDWGDAAWGHPFASLAITLDTTNEMLALQKTEVAALRTAYLGPWRSVVSGDLERALDLAIALRPAYGALLWARGFHAMRGADRTMAAKWVVRWLRRVAPTSCSDSVIKL